MVFIIEVALFVVVNVSIFLWDVLFTVSRLVLVVMVIGVLITVRLMSPLLSPNWNLWVRFPPLHKV